MDTYSTQAVSADTTLNPTPVKRWKRGDVREDGMVFWKYAKSCVCGARWVTPERLIELRAQGNADQKRRYANTPIEKRKADSKRHHAKNREADNARSRQYRKNNLQYFRNYENARYASDPVFAAKKRVRALVAYALRRLGVPKSGSTKASLGCSWEELKAHIGFQFAPGMSWENRHLWHIDHLVPLVLAKTAEEVYRLNHFTNLRPLWGPENQSKNKKVPEEHELPADLHDEVRKIWQRAKDSACAK